MANVFVIKIRALAFACYLVKASCRASHLFLRLLAQEAHRLSLTLFTLLSFFLFFCQSTFCPHNWNVRFIPMAYIKLSQP